MKKRALFRILSLTDSEDVIRLGKLIEGRHPVTVLKKPQKMLTMLKVRESAQGSLFYAGEALACDCMVAFGQAKGFAACLGDDTEKVYAMAIIDAALNAGLPEAGLVEDTLKGWEEAIRDRQAREARRTLSTKVNFTVMEE
jgi:alpha-D-ribose 1-methylphosphonate 5-triphosphate synthase subunit PhnG